MTCSAGDTFFGAEYADQKQRPREDIAQPCCCVHATTVPGPFWAAEWAIRQGWGGRPVRHEQAQGILLAALEMLAAAGGHRDRRAS